jgi:hypothetical protein
MSETAQIAVIGIDIGKNSFHIVGHDERGAIVLRQKWSRGQVEARFANLPPCLIGMEACVGAHHLGALPLRPSERRRAMLSPLCPNCVTPMILTRAIGRGGALADLHIFDCSSCHLSLTEAEQMPMESAGPAATGET